MAVSRTCPPWTQPSTDAVQSTISTGAGWFYVLSVNIYLGLVVYLLLSHYGHIRLGGAEAQP